MPKGMVVSAGLKASEVKVAFVTVRTAKAETFPERAVIVDWPAVRPCARPLVGIVVLMLATDSAEEDQVTVEVTSPVVPSAKVPLALNCCVVCAAMTGLGGSTAIETSGAVVTDNVVLPLIPPEVALIMTDPIPFPVATPALTVATVESEELHVADVVKSWLLPLLYVPIALNCRF